MKKQKSDSTQKNVSINKTFFQVFIISFICIALYLVLSNKNNTSKITPETNTPQVSLCSTESYPVCGKDRKTYINSCTAEKIANIRVAYTGECRDKELATMETLTPTLPSETGSEVDSGIENLGPIPKYTTDRTETGVVNPTLSDTGNIIITSETIHSLSGKIDSTWMNYSNSTYHYSFSMPKNSYYQAFGPQNGATHSVGISIGTGVESIENSQVRVYFYANKVLDKLSGITSGVFTDIRTGTIYVLLDTKNSVAIESDNPSGELVQAIFRSLHME